MIDDTNKPVTTEPAAPTTTPAAAARSLSPAPKPAPRLRPVKPAAPAAAKPARKRTAAVAKADTAPSKKPVTRSAARKTAQAKIVVHEPAPFVVKNSKGGKTAKEKKTKLVRDSFTMPELEYAPIAVLKKRCLDVGISVEKK